MIFVIMAIVLLVQARRPVRAGPQMSRHPTCDARRSADGFQASSPHWSLLALASLVAPFVLYPVFLMKVLCFALFACAFNLLLGYGGLLSFGHAAYLRHGGLRHAPTPPRSGA